MGEAGEVIFQQFQFRDHFHQFVEIAGVEEQIHVWEAQLQLFLLPSHHAASKHQRHIGLFLLDAPQVIEPACHFIFCGLPNHAGIEDDDVGIDLIIGFAVTNFLQHRRNLLAIGFIHLATHGPDEELFTVGRNWVAAHGRRVCRLVVWHQRNYAFGLHGNLR